MADTFTWSVVTLDREINNGVVHTVHWSILASRPNTDVSGEPYTANSYGATGFTADPSDPSFIPYIDLTEADCIGWVQNYMGTEEVNSMVSGLTTQLNEQETPTEAAGVPWSTLNS